MFRFLQSVSWTFDFSQSIPEMDWPLSWEYALGSLFPSHPPPWVRLWVFRWYDIYSNPWHSCARFITILVWWSTKASIKERCWVGFTGCLTTPTCSQQVSTGKCFTLYLHLWLLYIHILYLQGGNTTLPLLLIPDIAQFVGRVWVSLSQGFKLA